MIPLALYVFLGVIIFLLALICVFVFRSQREQQALTITGALLTGTIIRMFGPVYIGHLDIKASWISGIINVSIGELGIGHYVLAFGVGYLFLVALQLREKKKRASRA